MHRKVLYPGSDIWSVSHVSVGKTRWLIAMLASPGGPTEPNLSVYTENDRRQMWHDHITFQGVCYSLKTRHSGEEEVFGPSFSG